MGDNGSRLVTWFESQPARLGMGQLQWLDEKSDYWEAQHLTPMSKDHHPQIAQHVNIVYYS